jgi:hypothetical protein
MADEKPTTQNVESETAPIGMPRLEMPSDAALNDRGYIVFSIDTSEGPVHVESYWRNWNCRGTAAALIAAGLSRPEWFPGVPGNNKTRQKVLFGSDGPALLAGNHRGKKLAEACITVCRVSARTFIVDIPPTPDQCKRLEVFHEQREAKSSKGLRASETMSPTNAHIVYCNVAASAIDWIRRNLNGTGCAYTVGSMNRIQQSFEGLRRAFADGCVVPEVPLTPKYLCVGNVICWPGRGSVAAVAPTLLQ